MYIRNDDMLKWLPVGNSLNRMQFRHIAYNRTLFQCCENNGEFPIYILDLFSCELCFQELGGLL